MTTARLPCLLYFVRIAPQAIESLELFTGTCQSLHNYLNSPDFFPFGAHLLDLAEETDLLRKIPMFAKMDTSRLKLLAFASELVTFQDGDIVFNNGEGADFAYVIMDGAVDIITETDAGPVVTVTLTQNQLIGELGLLNNTPRIATLLANGELKAMKITGDMFFRLLRENSEFALDVIRMLSDKLTKSHHLVESLQRQISQKEGRE